MNPTFGRFFLVGMLAVCSLPASAEAARDIRAPLPAGLALTKDLSNEKQIPSIELAQVLEAAVQNKGFMFKIVVAKGSAMIAEVEKQVAARKLQDRVQLIEK
jgi:hypothetical protein